MATKRSSAWKSRLDNMTEAQREAYKKADNERVRLYREKRKLERGSPAPATSQAAREPAAPRVERAPRPAIAASTTPPDPAVTDVDVPAVDMPPSRALFTQYVGIGCKADWHIKPYSVPFHRSDFLALGLQPTEDVRAVPNIEFSQGERLHDAVRLYRATNEQRTVFLGVDDRAEEAAQRFARRIEKELTESAAADAISRKRAKRA